MRESHTDELSAASLMENVICNTMNSPSMQSNEERAPKKWYVRGRWALLLTVIGALLLSFVIVTRGEYATWLMWFAIPFLMIGLAYFFVVNWLAFYWGKT